VVGRRELELWGDGCHRSSRFECVTSNATAEGRFTTEVAKDAEDNATMA
jgi:hypothetical protein